MSKPEEHRDNPWANDDIKPDEEKTPIEIAREALLAQYEEHETCHICHFLVTILTAGFWFIPWMVFAYVNADRRDEIEDALDKIGSTENNIKENAGS
jgi:hypothetical protein